MKNKIRILSTKKLLPNQKQFLLNANFCLVEADFIKIDFQKNKIESKYDYLIFTSQNAVNSVLSNESFEDLKEKKCFCVGKKTKVLLEQNGFQVLQAFDYVEELTPFLITNYSHSTFTFFFREFKTEYFTCSFSKSSNDF